MKRQSTFWMLRTVNSHKCLDILMCITTFLLISTYLYTEKTSLVRRWRIAYNKLNTQSIPRIVSGKLQVEAFFKEYSTKPVIVEGEVRNHPAASFTYEDLIGLCGEGLVQTAVYSEEGDAWAGLTDRGSMPLKDYVQNYILKDSEELRYCAGDTSLPEVCPVLQLHTPIPKYVSIALRPVDAMVNVTINGRTVHRNFQQGQPEIFIGAEGTMTELHMDSMLIPFWMSVYSGAKKFRIILFDDMYQNLYYDLDSQHRYYAEYLDKSRGFIRKKQLEIWQPDFNIFPQLADVTVYEGIVNAGDWIYIPSGALHAVINIENSWAISSNALYPPVIDYFAEICSKSDFAMDCLEFSVDTAQCKGMKVKRKEDLQECLMGASESIAFYESKSKDFHERYIYEMDGFESYVDWCKENCRIMGDRFNRTQNFDKTESELLDNLNMVEHACKQCSDAS